MELKTVVMALTRKLIDDINSKIEKLQELRQGIQNECNHKEKIMPYSWRIGCEANAYVCEECDTFIEYVAQRQFSEKSNTKLV